MDNGNTLTTGEWSRLARLSKFDLEQFTKLSGVGRRQLERACEKELGRTPGEWLKQHRLFAASWLLREKSIKEVACELEYKQASHFSRSFKEYYGLTPTEYQRKFKNEP